MSESPEACAEDTRLGRMRFPRFNRIEVGSNNRISFAKLDNRVEGSLEVVTSTRGSTMPERCAYSSSRSNSSFAVKSGRASSYLKSSRSVLSFAIEGSSGFPDAKEARSFARFSATSAFCRVRALR